MPITDCFRCDEKNRENLRDQIQNLLRFKLRLVVFPFLWTVLKSIHDLYPKYLIPLQTYAFKFYYSQLPMYTETKFGLVLILCLLLFSNNKRIDGFANFCIFMMIVAGIAFTLLHFTDFYTISISTISYFIHWIEGIILLIISCRTVFYKLLKFCQAVKSRLLSYGFLVSPIYEPTENNQDITSENQLLNELSMFMHNFVSDYNTDQDVLRKSMNQVQQYQVKLVS